MLDRTQKFYSNALKSVLYILDRRENINSKGFEERSLYVRLENIWLESFEEGNLLIRVGRKKSFEEVR